jgi:hypothetical protein
MLPTPPAVTVSVDAFPYHRGRFLMNRFGDTIELCRRPECVIPSKMFGDESINFHGEFRRVLSRESGSCQHDVGPERRTSAFKRMCSPSVFDIANVVLIVLIPISASSFSAVISNLHPHISKCN